MELQDGKTVTVVLKLRKGLTVTGTVTDEEGKPVAGVDFCIRMPYDLNNAWMENRNDTEVHFTTDQQGHFTVSGLPAGKGTLMLSRQSSDL